MGRRPGRVTFAAHASVWLGLFLAPATYLVAAVAYMAESPWGRAAAYLLFWACSLSGALSMIVGLAMFRRRAWGRRVALALMPAWCGLFLSYVAGFAFVSMGRALSMAVQGSAAAVAMLIAIPLVGMALYALVPALVFLELRHDEAAEWFREGAAR